MPLVSWVRARTPLELCGLASVLVLAATALVAPLALGHAASAVHVDRALQGSSGAHWLGTDDLGRDLLARVLVATRLSLALALGATGIGITCGILFGAAALAPRIGSTVAAAINVAIAFPGLLSALFFAVIFGVGERGAMFAVGLAMAPGFARLMYTLGAAVLEMEYIGAARLLGLRRGRILLRYVLPNIADALIVNVAMAAGAALVVFAELSFLGVGVQAPSYDWGLLLQSGLGRIYTAPASALAPGVAICAAGIAFNIVGERAASRFVAATARARPVRPRRRPIDRPDSADTVRVDGLSISFPGRDGRLHTVVQDVSFVIRRGERVGLVGESGSGKSVTASALAGLLPHPGRATANQLTIGGYDPGVARGRPRRRLLKGLVGIAFQDPSRAFNPVLRIGTQIAEAQAAGTRAQRRARAVEHLDSLKVAAPALRVRQYPHQLSGGTLQRAMTALALTAEPMLLIADEPTTALDVTVQAVALRTLDAALDRTGAALLFISHDIAVVADMCDRVLVMYAGRIVESLPVAELRGGAAHPYTRALLDAVEDLSTSRDRPLRTLPALPTLPTFSSAAALPVGSGSGCPFAPRCSAATARCRDEAPAVLQLADGHDVACWHPRVEAAAVGEGAS